MPNLIEQQEQVVEHRQISVSHLRWYFGFFVTSGFCGLIYEVVWLRLAMASFGVTTALVSIVISMFMAGLGLGSWAAGTLTRRAGNARVALRLYALAELIVGISSIVVPYELKAGRLLLQNFGSFAVWQSSRYYLLSGLWVAIALVPWCTCMGSTFPLLMHVMRQTARPKSERSFSYLYLANVAGALLGTLASAFVLIELIGFTRTLYVAGVLNAALAVTAFTLSSHLPVRVGFHFLASMEPLPETSSSVLASRMPSAAVPDFLEWGPESTVKSQFEMVVSQERTMQQILDRDPKIQAIRDDEPVNEYYLLRGWFHLDR